MTEAEIIEIFIKAATVDRKLPDTARPKRLKAMSIEYVHDVADINGWSSEDKNALRWDWLNPEKLRNTRNDIALWECSMEMITLVPDPKKRRALWAWATAEAGGQPFSRWCEKVEGISRQAGNWRKTSAIGIIVAAFSRKPLQHNDNAGLANFTNQPEISDKRDNIRAWLADDAKPALTFDEDLRDFSWAEAQNAKRREREARRRNAASAGTA